MIGECVGLDIGQTAIKAVRFRRRLSGRESVEYFHLPLPYGSRSRLNRLVLPDSFGISCGRTGSTEAVTLLQPSPAKISLSVPCPFPSAMLPSSDKSSRMKWKI